MKCQMVMSDAGTRVEDASRAVFTSLKTVSRCDCLARACTKTSVCARWHGSTGSTSAFSLLVNKHGLRSKRKCKKSLKNKDRKFDTANIVNVGSYFPVKHSASLFGLFWWFNFKLWIFHSSGFKSWRYKYYTSMVRSWQLYQLQQDLHLALRNQAKYFQRLGRWRLSVSKYDAKQDQNEIIAS